MDNTLDYSHILLAHVVCADRQIHIAESRRLAAIANETEINQATLSAMQDVLCQGETAPTIIECLEAIPAEKRTLTLRAAVAMAYVDGICDPAERDFMDGVALAWGYKPSILDRWCANAEAQLQQEQRKNGKDFKFLSFGEQLKRPLDSEHAHEVVDALSHHAVEASEQPLDQNGSKASLAGPDYEDAIRNCFKIAKQDISVAEKALVDTRDLLRAVRENIVDEIDKLKGQSRGVAAESAREVIERFEKDKDKLESALLREQERVRVSLYRKRRATKYFTISFMGKSKAGKSTLHAVMTGEGWDAIGVGNQRTTRYNRVYEWNNLRIIDTPGIGAPGGKTDEEIAKSVIGESDIVVFILTNNNQQETEFQFLKLLKEKAKPLVILLNVQENLHHPIRMEDFLKDPNRLFSEDPNHLGGHVERIRRYAKKYYGNDFFDIVPVQLLAAELSRTLQDEKLGPMLLTASQLQKFEGSIKLALIGAGAIRRSQTILGSTVSDILGPATWLGEHSKIYSDLAMQLEQRKNQAVLRIIQEGKSAEELLGSGVKKIFHSMKGTVPAFAEDHWDEDQQSLEKSWKEHFQQNNITQRLESEAAHVVDGYVTNVKEIMEEMGRDISMASDLGGFSFSLMSQDASTFGKSFFKWGGTALAITGTVLAFIPGVNIAAAIVAGVAAAVFSVVSALFTSREKKQRKAVAAISESLNRQLESSRKQVEKDYKNRFKAQCQALERSVQAYFDLLINGLTMLGETMNSSHAKLENSADSLNRAYAKRILDYCQDKIEPLNGSTINATVASVDRVVGQKITIRTRKEIVLEKRTEAVSQTLQETLTISTN